MKGGTFNQNQLLCTGSLSRQIHGSFDTNTSVRQKLNQQPLITATINQAHDQMVRLEH